MRDVSPLAPRPSLVPYHPQHEEDLREACERECLRPSGSTTGGASPAAATQSPSAAGTRGGAAAPSYGSTGGAGSSEGRRRPGWRGNTSCSTARSGRWMELLGSVRNVFRPAAYFGGWRSDATGVEGKKGVQVLPYEPLKKKTRRRGSLVRWLLSGGFCLAAAAVLATLGLVMSLLFWLCIRGPSVTGRLQSGQSRVLRADPRYFKALLVRESSGSSSAPPLSLYTSLTKPQPSTQLRLHTLPDDDKPIELPGGQSQVLALRDPSGAPIKALDLDFRATGADVWLWLLRPEQLRGFTKALSQHSLDDHYSPQDEDSPHNALPLHPNALATQYGTWVPVRAVVSGAKGSGVLYVVLHNPATKARAKVQLSSLTLTASVTALDLSKAHPLACGPSDVALQQDSHEADKHQPRALRSSASSEAMSLRCRASLDTDHSTTTKTQDLHSGGVVGSYVVLQAPSVDEASGSDDMSRYSYSFHVSKVLGPMGKAVLLGLALGPLCVLLLALGALLVVDKLSPAPYTGLYALERRPTADTLSDASLSGSSSYSSEDEDDDRVAPWQKERVGAPPGFQLATPAAAGPKPAATHS